MSVALSPVAEAIGLALTSVSPQIAGGRIFDDVPQEPDFPYVHIGEQTEEPADTDEALGADEVQTIHVYSRERGYRETQLIIREIVNALHKQSLTVTGRTTALAWYTGANVFMDQDGVTRHGIVRIRVLTYE